MLEVHRVSGPDAWAFIAAAIGQHHRHHEAPQGWKWGYIATKSGRIVGVATIGRAVGRWGRPMLELTRGCTWSRARYGAASAMLQAAARDCGHRGHAQLAAHRLRGEWFAPSPEVLEEVSRGDGG